MNSVTSFKLDFIEYGARGTPQFDFETMHTIQRQQATPENVKKYRQKECKSFAERKRRNRINGCLEELKVSILGSSFKNIKMEQAEVLELTVQYLKLVKSQRLTTKNEEFAESLCEPLRCHTLKQQKQLDGRKRNRLEDFLEEDVDDVIPLKSRKLCRKLKAKQFEFFPKSASERLGTKTPQNGAKISGSSSRRPLGTLNNTTGEEKRCILWRPW